MLVRTHTTQHCSCDQSCDSYVTVMCSGCVFPGALQRLKEDGIRLYLQGLFYQRYNEDEVVLEVQVMCTLTLQWET